MKEYYFKFFHDDRGCGPLQLCEDCGHVEMEYEARSGSRDESGKLKNCIVSDTYLILDEWPPVFTREEGMFIVPGKGWKVKLYKRLNTFKLEYRGYLIHPDGGKGGSLGCIVLIGTDAHPLRDKIAEVLKDQKEIRVYVGKKGE